MVTQKLSKALVFAGVALLLAACGNKTAPPPAPGTVRGTPPDLRGRRVVVYPVQQNYGVAGDPYAELVFGLQDRSRDVDWVLAQEVDEILDRSPSVSARIRGLPVGNFLAAEVRRVGDPLYGDLRRVSALVDAEVVLLPVQAAVTAEPGEGSKVTLTVTLIEPRTGRVAWFAILQGVEHDPGDPRGLASAVEEVARRLLWYVAG